MKYMMLMQFSAATADFPGIDTWTREELQAHIEFMHLVNRELVASGEFVDAQGLAGADTAKLVRSGNGNSPLVTEGPFPETKEFLAGYWILDCETEERAVELAARVSAAPGPRGEPLNMPIEVRPVMSAPPAEL
jgi:hypothetical protein